MCHLNVYQFGPSNPFSNTIIKYISMKWNVKCHVDNDITQFEWHIVNNQFKTVTVWTILTVSWNC
jgi:hypothetical protein